MVGLGILGIREQDGDQQLRIKDVDSHRSVAMPRMVRRFLWNRRLFFESDNAPILVGFNHAKLLGGLRSWNFNGRNRDVRAGVAVLLQHAAVIHLVDMVAKNENEFGTLAA